MAESFLAIIEVKLANPSINIQKDALLLLQKLLEYLSATDADGSVEIDVFRSIFWHPISFLVVDLCKHICKDLRIEYC